MRNNKDTISIKNTTAFETSKDLRRINKNEREYQIKNEGDKRDIQECKVKICEMRYQ